MAKSAWRTTEARLGPRSIKQKIFPHCKFHAFVVIATGIRMSRKQVVCIRANVVRNTNAYKARMAWNSLEKI